MLVYIENVCRFLYLSFFAPFQRLLCYMLMINSQTLFVIFCYIVILHISHMAIDDDTTAAATVTRQMRNGKQTHTHTVDRRRRRSRTRKKQRKRQMKMKTDRWRRGHSLVVHSWTHTQQSTAEYSSSSTHWRWDERKCVFYFNFQKRNAFCYLCASS